MNSILAHLLVLSLAAQCQWISPFGYGLGIFGGYYPAVGFPAAYTGYPTSFPYFGYPTFTPELVAVASRTEIPTPVEPVAAPDVAVKTPVAEVAPVNALPVPVQDTAEVAAAKQEFAVLYAAAKAAAAAAKAAAAAAPETAPVSRRKRQVPLPYMNAGYSPLAYNYGFPSAYNYANLYGYNLYNPYAVNYANPWAINTQQPIGYNFVPPVVAPPVVAAPSVVGEPSGATSNVIKATIQTA